MEHKYDKHAVVSCDNCDAGDYQLNFSEDVGMPEICPFCSEPLEDVMVFDTDEFETDDFTSLNDRVVCSGGSCEINP